MEMMYTEHAIINRAEQVIDSINVLWEKDAGKYESTVKQLIKFFREYADGFHHRKEEEVLFPLIVSHPDFVIPGMVDSLMQHHDEFREYARDIQLALEKMDYAESYKLLTHYMHDLHDHISAENDELFVLAGNLFSPGQLESIYYQFQDIDRELGWDRKSSLEELILVLYEDQKVV